MGLFLVVPCHHFPVTPRASALRQQDTGCGKCTLVSNRTRKRKKIPPSLKKRELEPDSLLCGVRCREWRGSPLTPRHCVRQQLVHLCLASGSHCKMIGQLQKGRRKRRAKAPATTHLLGRYPALLLARTTLPPKRLLNRGARLVSGIPPMPPSRQKANP